MSILSRAVLVSGPYPQALACARSLKLIGDQTPRFYQGTPTDETWRTCFVGFVSEIAELEAEQVLVLKAPMLAFKRLGAIFDAGVGHSLCRQEGYRESVDTNLVLLENSDCGRKLLLGLDREDGVSKILPRHHQFVVTTPGNRSIDVRTNRCELLVDIEGLRRVEPCIWSPLDSNDAAYRRECVKLERLAAIEQRMSRGQISPLLKTRRSFEKRVLKLMGKM